MNTASKRGLSGGVRKKDVMNSAVILINCLGILIGLFSVVVTLQILRKYRLKSTLLFVATAVGISIWNIIHLIFVFLPPTTSSTTVWILWEILVNTGLGFLFAFIIGYHRLHYTSTQSRMYFYIFFAGFCSAIFLTQPEWITYTYHQGSDGYTTMANTVFWTTFSVISGLIVTREMLIPFARIYLEKKHVQSKIIQMIGAVLLALFSNLLLPLIEFVGLPQAFRFLLGNVGFLIYFTLLHKYPFLGFHDLAEIKQIIVSSVHGEPLLVLSDLPLDEQHNTILTSGAFTSINSFLEEITRTRYNESEEIIREIQLGKSQFFITIRHQIKVIYWYNYSTGACRAKFKSLARMLPEEPLQITQKTVEEIKSRVDTYFPDFRNYVLYYQVI